MESAGLGAYVPPHNIDAEQSTLGAVLIDDATLGIVSDILTGEDFYRENHRILFDVLMTIKGRNLPVDLITVQEELNNRDKLEAIGGMPYLTSLFDTVPTAKNAEYYAKIVREKAILRRLIGAAFEIIGAARGEVENIDDVIAAAQSAVLTVGACARKDDLLPLGPEIQDAVDAASDEAVASMEGRSTPFGLSTGIRAFDGMTSGLQPTDLIIVGAASSMGKTSFCLSVAEHIALVEKKTVAIFSLEMSRRQIAIRMACTYARVDSRAFRKGKLEKEQWELVHQLEETLYNHPTLYVCEETTMTVSSMRAKLRRLQHERGLGLVIVDYLQLVTPEKQTGNRVAEVGQIAAGLKSMAREFAVPVIAPSQLSRSVDARQNKRPVLSDLRESGDIGNTADITAFLYRPAYYQRNETEAMDEAKVASGDPELEAAELIVAKHRNGPTGIVKVGFVAQWARYGNWSDLAHGVGPTGY